MPYNNLFKSIRYTLYILIFICFFTFYYLLVNPILYIVTKSNNTIEANETNLKAHVLYLTTTKKERNYKEIETLNQVGEYIYDHFKKSGCDKIYYQNFQASGKSYRNIICNFIGKKDKKIIVGAHYDVDSDNTLKSHKESTNGYYAGADDNASGIAGILEISTMLGKNKNNINKSIELVAYNLEEMPFFDSDNMGSFIHAKSLFDKKENIDYMISLEMIGYFSDEKIQTYPIRFLSRFYPSKGNFIAIVGQLFDFDIKDLKLKMIKNSHINTKSLSAPNFINGVSFSDHRNYWHFGYKAYMITDTSYFRNKNYHKTTDTIDTLDFEKMREVVNGVFGIIIK